MAKMICFYGFFQTCMAFLTAYVFTMYAFKRNNHKLWNMTYDFVYTKKTMAETWVRQKIARGKVEPVVEVSVEDCGKSFENSHVCRHPNSRVHDRA